MTLGKSEFGEAREVNDEKSHRLTRRIVGARSEERGPTVRIHAFATAHSHSPERHVGHPKRHFNICGFEFHNASAWQHHTSTTNMVTCDIFNMSFASFSMDSSTPNVVMMMMMTHTRHNRPHHLPRPCTATATVTRHSRLGPIWKQSPPYSTGGLSVFVGTTQMYNANNKERFKSSQDYVETERWNGIDKY